MLAQDSYEGNNYYCMVLVSKLVLGVIGMEAAESPRLLARLAGGEEAPGPRRQSLDGACRAGAPPARGEVMRAGGAGNDPAGGP